MVVSILVLKIIVKGQLDIKGNKHPGLSTKKVTNKWLFTITYNCYLLMVITLFQHVVQALHHSVGERNSELKSTQREKGKRKKPLGGKIQ